jgi:iron complex outermembrane receptor protein
MPFRHCSGAAILFGVSAVALAQPPHSQQDRKPFDIAAGPAANAIAEFARQAQRNVLAAGDTLEGVKTNALHGNHDVDDALARLLAGTGLASKTTAGGAIFITVAPRVPPKAAPQPPCCVPSAPSASTAPADMLHEPHVVTVRGMRYSVMSAIENKKSAFTVADAIAAEDIGHFPDKNIGEALSRITGVQITTDFGEGNQISIRGVQPDLNRIEINGMTLLSSGESGTRAPDLRELPSELVKSIDVIKGITADMTEGGLGGTVVIKTNRPLDFKQFTIAANAAAERNSLRGGTQPRASLLIADRFLGRKLGLMANMVYDKVLTEADRVRDTSWRLLRDWDLSPEKTIISTNPALAAISSKAACAGFGTGRVAECERQWYDYSPATPRYGILTRDHARATGEFTAQYAFDKNVNAWASFQRSSQDSWLNDLNYTADFSSADRLASAGAPASYNASGVPAGGSCITPGTASTPSGVVVTNHQVTEYVVGNCLAVPGRGGSNAFSTQARSFGQRVDTTYRSAGFNARAGRWDAGGMIVKSRADYSNDSNFVGLTMAAPGMKVTLDPQGFPHFTFPANWNPNNAASYTQAQFSYLPVEMNSWEDQAKLDLRYRTGLPFIHQVSFGVQGRSAGALRYADGGYVVDGGSNLASSADDLSVTSANVRYTWNWDPQNPTAALRPATVQPFTNANDKEIWVSSQQMQQLVNAIRSTSPTFLQGSRLGGFPAGWMTPSYSAALPFFDTSTFTHDLVRQAPGSDGNTYAQIPAYRVEERIRAAYVRFDVAYDLPGHPITGNIGLRYAQTRDRTIGRQRLFMRLERSPGSASYDDRQVATTVVSKDMTYHDLMPSANAMVWLRPDTLVLRLGYGKVMARPSLDSLNPNFTCTINSGKPQFGGDGYDNCSGGNPDLKPYRASNKDLSLEWYPNKSTQLSAAYFRKDIQNSILNNVTIRTDFLGTGTLYDVTTTINHDGATTSGIEMAGRMALTFLPGVLNGLGVDANFTRMSYAYAAGAEMVNPLDGNLLPFPGMSKTAYDLGFWYDKGRLNARLAYNYRAGYYTGTNDSSSGNPVFAAPTGFLDAKVQYRISDHMTLSLEAKNLTNEVTLTSAGAVSRPIEYSWAGRRYFVSLGYKY